MKRKFYEELLEWKDKVNPKPMLVIGARQVGKTYIINEFIKNEFEKYNSFNLLHDTRITDLYDSNLTEEEKYNSLKSLTGFDLDKEGILFIDEVQKSKNFISSLKYIRENHKSAKIICAGSFLGVTLDEFEGSFPVGQLEKHYMYPMDFEEFLMACSEVVLIDMIKKSYSSNTPLIDSFHTQALQYYKYYLIIGGMPECVSNFISVNKDIINYDKNIIADIESEYFEDMNNHIKNSNMVIKTRELYKSVARQLGNDSNKFQYSKISHGARARDYFDPLNWLMSARLVIKTNLVKLPEIPLEANIDENHFKLYFEDVAFLTNSLKISTNDILFNKIGYALEWITENYVAEELNTGSPLYYWKSNNIAKVDFIIKDLDGVIPVEVKSSDNTRSKSLNEYIKKYNPKYSIRISSKNFGFENNIKSVPLYAVFCIKDDILKDK